MYFQLLFYWSYQLDNLEGAYLNSKTTIENGYSWGEACQVDRISLKVEECHEFISPAIKNFAENGNKNFK